MYSSLQISLVSTLIPTDFLPDFIFEVLLLLKYSSISFFRFIHPFTTLKKVKTYPKIKTQKPTPT